MAKSENVTFWPPTNSTIRGNLITPIEGGCSRPGVLFLHGYDSSRTGAVERATQLIDSGIDITALAIDLGGHGQSVVFDDSNKQQRIPRTRITINEHLREVKRSYDALRFAPGVDSERIGVVGASYGGYLALLLATYGQHPVKSLILRAPAIYPDGLEDVPRSEYNMDEIDAFQSDLNAIKGSEAWKRKEEFEGPLWIVESGEDESIPSTVMDAYEQGSQNPTRLLIPGAPHSLQEAEHKALYQSYLADWAKEL